MPLMFSGAAAIAQKATTASNNSKPQSNRERLPQVRLSGKKNGIPGRRVGGGSRIPGCTSALNATAMISPRDNVTVTTSTQPSLMFWLDESDGERDVELALRAGFDGSGPEVYRTMVKLSGQAGLLTLDLSELEDAPRLTQGEDYYIYLSWICDASDRSKDIVVEGSLSPVDLDQWVAQRSPLPVSNAEMNQSDSFFQVEQSIELGLWHDAMVQLNQLRQEGSSSAIRQQAQQRWQALLEADDELSVIADGTRTVTSPLAIAAAQELDRF